MQKSQMQWRCLKQSYAINIQTAYASTWQHILQEIVPCSCKRTFQKIEKTISQFQPFMKEVGLPNHDLQKDLLSSGSYLASDHHISVSLLHLTPPKEPHIPVFQRCSLQAQLKSCSFFRVSFLRWNVNLECQLQEDALHLPKGCVRRFHQTICHLPNCAEAASRIMSSAPLAQQAELKLHRQSFISPCPRRSILDRYGPTLTWLSMAHLKRNCVKWAVVHSREEN